jgi:hypothetical protein
VIVFKCGIHTTGPVDHQVQVPLRFDRVKYGWRCPAEGKFSGPVMPTAALLARLDDGGRGVVGEPTDLSGGTVVALVDTDKWKAAP